MPTTAQVQSIDVRSRKRFSNDARVNQPLLESKDFITRMNCYEPGQVTPFHVHPNDDEVIYCIEGRGAITLDEGDSVPIHPGSLVLLPAGLPHGIAAAADSRLVVIYMTSAGYTSVRAEGRRGDAGIALPGERTPR
jgi:quercetin dioxygenase-like cupin family protein